MFFLPGSLPVSVEPTVRLINWEIRQVHDGDRHIIGGKEDRGPEHARVSSPLMTFDEKTNIATTQSGRVYELIGPSGATEYVKAFWEDYKIGFRLKEI